MDRFPSVIRLGIRHSLKRRRLMQFALLIYDSPEAFVVRKSEGADRYTGARRAYYQALLEAGDSLEVPETGTTVRINDGERSAKEQLGGFTVSPELRRRVEK